MRYKCWPRWDQVMCLLVVLLIDEEYILQNCEYSSDKKLGQIKRKLLGHKQVFIKTSKVWWHCGIVLWNGTLNLKEWDATVICSIQWLFWLTTGRDMQNNIIRILQKIVNLYIFINKLLIYLIVDLYWKEVCLAMSSWSG